MTSRVTTALALLAAAVLAVSGAAHAQEAPWRAKVRSFAQAHFIHNAWGYSHSARDYRLAKALAAADHMALDDDVIFAAAYLHDMAAFAPWARDKEDHSDVAATTIDLVLGDTDFPKAKLDAVRAAVRTHMYYRDPVAPEAVYLHDADALDWLGAIGVARILASIDPKAEIKSTTAALQLIQQNLKDVPSRVVSPAGKAMTAPRLAESRRFLDELKAESEGFAEF